VLNPAGRVIASRGWLLAFWPAGQSTDSCGKNTARILYSEQTSNDRFKLIAAVRKVQWYDAEWNPGAVNPTGKIRRKPETRQYSLSTDRYELRIMCFMVNSLPWQWGDSIRCTFRQCDSRYSHIDRQCACNLC